MLAHVPLWTVVVGTILLVFGGGTFSVKLTSKKGIAADDAMVLFGVFIVLFPLFGGMLLIGIALLYEAIAVQAQSLLGLGMIAFLGLAFILIPVGSFSGLFRDYFERS